MNHETDLNRYRDLLTQAIRECEAAKRPARAAWLMHHLRKSNPTFKLADLGFSNFREFATALGGFTLTHDAYDVVAAIGESAGAPSQARNSRFEKVQPNLWRVLTGADAPPVYLDVRALHETNRVVLRRERAEADRDLRELPAISDRDQAEWLVAWAQKQGMAGDDLAHLREAIAAGGVQRALVVFRQKGLDRQLLIDRIEWTKDCLRQWSTANGLEWGPPVIEVYRPAFRSLPAPAATSGGVTELREIVMGALSRLPQEELRQLWLPVGLVYDVICGKRSG